MALQNKQLQRLTTRIAITPQLKQSIHILQLPIMELKQYVETQLQENPMLEIVDPADQLNTELPGDNSRTATEASERAHEDTPAPEPANEWERVYLEDGVPEAAERHWSEEWEAMPSRDEQERQHYRETLITKGISLRDHLLEQLRFNYFDPAMLDTLQYMIGCLDHAGYFNHSIAEIAGMLDVAPAHVEEALRILQSFDPPGVGARSLQECLLLQLQARGEGASLAAKIVSEHLPDLANQRYRCIAKSLNVKAEAVLAAAQEIRTLTPKPGAALTEDVAGHIMPDIMIVFDGESYAVTTNDTEVPQLKINHRYRQLLEDPSSDPSTRAYIKGRVEAAMWVIKAIRQRQRTLHQIAEAILEAQQDFFQRGPGFLKPLTFRDIATKLGIHESTVSRAIAGKFAETPQGMLPLKSLFDRGVHQGNSLDATSSESIKNLIKTYIQQEDPSAPLSDETLVELLARRGGVRVARRTVAKYREELRIPSSYHRRQHALLP